MDSATIGVREAERRFLAWTWWVFPLGGMFAAMLKGDEFWAWVNGGCPWLDWRQALTWRAALLGGMGLVATGVWRVLLRRKWPEWVLLLVVAAGVAGMECAVRGATVQSAFWLATRTRGYLPEVGYVRLEEVAGRPDGGPGIVLAGSSQMIFGVDEQLLRERLAPTPVVRRAIAGMWPQSMLAMWKWFSFRPGDVCVQVRSAFDFLDKPEFDADWFRPVASMEGVGMVLRSAGWRILSRNGGKVLDFLLAASLEGWRMRDGMRVLAMHWLPEPEKIGSGEMLARKEKRRTWAEATWSEWQWRAFEEGARRLKESGVEFLVFEGDVNPALHVEGWEEKRQDWLRRLADGEREGLWHLVGLEEQNAGLVPDDWMDGTHVTRSGRAKLTQAMGRVLAKRGGRYE